MDEKIKNHKLLCLNRNELSVTGVSKVNSATEKQINLVINNEQLIIFGMNLHVNKLDIEQGIVEIVGTVDSIKYSKSNAIKEGFFKRIFK